MLTANMTIRFRMISETEFSILDFFDFSIIKCLLATLSVSPSEGHIKVD